MISTPTVLSVTFALCVTTFAAAAGEDDYIHCSITSIDRGTRFYSDVFRGDYGLTTRYKNRFHDYLEGRLGASASAASAYCFKEETRSDAEAELNRHMSQSRRAGFKVQMTHWRP